MKVAQYRIPCTQYHYCENEPFPMLMIPCFKVTNNPQSQYAPRVKYLYGVLPRRSKHAQI